MCNVHQDFMSEWAINNGKTVAKNCDTGDYQIQIRHTSLNMYQTEEQIGEKLQFHGASEEREGAIKGDKSSDENGSDPGSDLSDDLTR